MILFTQAASCIQKGTVGSNEGRLRKRWFTDGTTEAHGEHTGNMLAIFASSVGVWDVPGDDGRHSASVSGIYSAKTVSAQRSCAAHRLTTQDGHGI